MPAAAGQGGRMQQIKFFTGIEGELTKLENDVNGWIAQTKPARIVSIFGNIAPQGVLPQGEQRKVSNESGSRRFAPSDVMVCVVYEK